MWRAILIILFILISSSVFGQNEYVFFDLGERDTVKFGEPELLFENDSIFLSIPFSAWVDEEMVGFFTMISPGFYDTSLVFYKWVDASDAYPISKAKEFTISYRTPGFYLHLSAADPEMFKKVQEYQKDEALHYGNIVYTMPQSLLKSTDVDSLHKAETFINIVQIFFQFNKVNVPIIYNHYSEYKTDHSKSLIGSFSFTPDSGYAPLTVQFSDNSFNRKKDNELLWYFDDGDTLREVNPEHVYIKPGTYYPGVHFPLNKTGVSLQSLFPITVLDSNTVVEEK